MKIKMYIFSLLICFIGFFVTYYLFELIVGNPITVAEGLVGALGFTCVIGIFSLLSLFLKRNNDK